MDRVPATLVAVLLMLTACGTEPDGTATGTSDQSTDVADTDAEDTTTDGSDTGRSDDSSGQDTTDGGEQLFPDVVAVEAVHDGDGSWTFSVTLSSPYDSPERYADAWRVVGPDGSVFGERILAHDHAAEQPFTRSKSGIEIPADVTTVTVEGRDQVSGWGGATVDVVLER